jgi:hypothetical protein
LIEADDGPRVANDDNDDRKMSRIGKGGGGGGLGGKAHRRNVVVVAKSSQQEPHLRTEPVARREGGEGGGVHLGARGGRRWRRQGW